jgi:hypothetical protein
MAAFFRGNKIVTIDDDSTTTDRVTDVLKHFVVLDIEEFFGKNAIIIDENNEDNDVFNDALNELKRVIKTASMPLTLVSQSISQQRLQALHAAESIRQLKFVKSGEDLTIELRAEAKRAALDRFASETKDLAGSKAIAARVVDRLSELMQSEETKDSSSELLLQTLISTWSVSEHFASRFLVQTLNKHPQLSLKILSEDHIKIHFGKLSFDIDALAEYDFNIHRKMGNLIFSNRRLYNVWILLQIIQMISKDPSSLEPCIKPLKELSLLRNIIVHKRGIVDQKFSQHFASRHIIGSRVQLNAEEIISFFSVVRDAIVIIYNDQALFG